LVAVICDEINTNNNNSMVCSQSMVVFAALVILFVTLVILCNFLAVPAFAVRFIYVQCFRCFFRYSPNVLRRSIFCLYMVNFGLFSPLSSYLLFTFSSGLIWATSIYVAASRGPPFLPVSFKGVVMSQSQPCPLSQTAAKPSAVCSICFASHQIHLKDGTLQLHGPRHKPCPDSNLPPIGHASTSQGSQIQSNSQFSAAGGQSTAQLKADILSTSSAAPPLANINTLASTTDTSSANGSVQPSVSHPACRGPIIKHIPRSARQHIAAELSSVLSHICSNHCQIHKRLSADQSLATAVVSKIEDGNIKAAICIVTSGRSLAVDNAQTYQSLLDWHPQAPFN
jgi:hypothetical protein